MSSLQDGVAGLPPQDEDLEDYTTYGIDWEELNDPRCRVQRFVARFSLLTLVRLLFRQAGWLIG